MAYATSLSLRAGKAVVRNDMFDVEVCEPKRVVLIRFRGELAQADSRPRCDGPGDAGRAAL